MNNFGEHVFKAAQKNVPSNTGHLKDSAQFLPVPDGFTIMYDTPYAYALHEGLPQNNMEAHVSEIPKHMRRIKGRSQKIRLSSMVTISMMEVKLIPVKEHTKTYQIGFKPILGKNNQWQTHSTIPKKDWIQEAYKNIYNEFVRAIKVVNFSKLLPREINIQYQQVTSQ